MSNTLDDNTLNIIGVLSYKIDDIHNCLTPEYYFPNFNLVKQTDEDAMYASGLFKSNNLELTVNDIKATNMLGRKDLISSNIDSILDTILVSGENLNAILISSNIDLTLNSILISSNIDLTLDNILVSGKNLDTILVSSENLNNILVSGENLDNILVSGENLNTILISSNIDLTLDNTLVSGENVDTILVSGGNLDNILVSGENLDKYPKSRDENNKYAKELWKLVEFVTTNTSLDILNKGENKIYINSAKAILEQNAALYKKIDYEQINLDITWFVYFNSDGDKQIISSNDLKTSGISNNQLIGPFKTKTEAENFGNSNA